VIARRARLDGESLVGTGTQAAHVPAIEMPGRRGVASPDKDFEDYLLPLSETPPG
jgi:hypothetical protein